MEQLFIIAHSEQDTALNPPLHRSGEVAGVQADLLSNLRLSSCTVTEIEGSQLPRVESYELADAFGFQSHPPDHLQRGH
jgi:hypothetical protein